MNLYKLQKARGSFIIPQRNKPSSIMLCNADNFKAAINLNISFARHESGLFVLDATYHEGLSEP